ncbi:MAG: BlaI/MecI/CopY family transcriptional regulator [Planctomycetes bacterium]|jgi:BlaI family penicillinase repressor|nr:BlaI/MecI/CopY family transcriptional regulator [Planctomycetota bacterium]
MNLSEAEWTVMNAVWSKAPASVRDVQDRVGAERGWAHTTVKTMLDRLVAKGALREKKRANASIYEPRISREEARTSALRALLTRSFDGSFGSLVHHIVSEERLSKKERERLARQLGDDDAEERP